MSDILFSSEVKKICLRCKKELPLEAFGIDLARSLGRAIYCLSCNRNRATEYRRTPNGKAVHSRATKKWNGTEKGRAWLKETRKARYRTVDRFRLNRALAVRTGKRWAIEQEVYELLIHFPCHYCGGALPQTSYGLDRLNNSKGYEPENVVPCCSLCNYARRDQFTPEEMERFVGPAIREVRLARGEIL